MSLERSLGHAEEEVLREAETLAGLVRKFESSFDFSGTAETTQREYRRIFRVIDRHWVSFPKIPSGLDSHRKAESSHH
jgi:hypothetical protein